MIFLFCPNQVKSFSIPRPKFWRISLGPGKYIYLFLIFWCSRNDPWLFQSFLQLIPHVPVFRKWFMAIEPFLVFLWFLSGELLTHGGASWAYLSPTWLSVCFYRCNRLNWNHIAVPVPLGRKGAPSRIWTLECKVPLPGTLPTWAASPPPPPPPWPCRSDQCCIHSIQACLEVIFGLQTKKSKSSVGSLTCLICPWKTRKKRTVQIQHGVERRLENQSQTRCCLFFSFLFVLFLFCTTEKPIFNFPFLPASLSPT